MSNGLVFRGDEFLLLFSKAPITMTSFNLESASKEGNSFGVLSVAEIQTIKLSQESSICKIYNTNQASYSDYIMCYKNWVSQIIHEIPCLMPGLEEFEFPLNDMKKECDNIFAAENCSAWLSSTILSTKNWIENCPIPCYQTTYNYRLEYFHKNKYIGSQNDVDLVDESTFTFFITFDTLLVEERSEALVYDGVNFLTAAGGNLGLFLGFSFFSILMTVLKQIQKLVN